LGIKKPPPNWWGFLETWRYYWVGPAYFNVSVIVVLTYGAAVITLGCNI
jgi:hypothetical protein